VDEVEDLEAHYDLIMLGKRGMGAENAVQHLGSNMERVVRTSKKPVLVTSRSFRPLTAWFSPMTAGRARSGRWSSCRARTLSTICRCMC
jgi:hypothetical protein